MTPQQAIALQAENASIKAQLTAAHTREAERVAALRHAENRAFAESQISAGKLAPKHKDAVVAFLNFSEISDGHGGALSFGEGDQAQTLHAAFKSFLGELPLLVSFGEQATKERAAGAETVNPLVIDAERRHLNK